MSTTIDTTAITPLSLPGNSLPTALPTNWTAADLQQHLGGIPLGRVRLYPPPGMATEEDALRLDDQEDCICELVDGVLVEKVMSFYESILAMALGHFVLSYLEQNSCGIVSGADGQIRILPTKMRVPDLAFIRWERFPNRELPKDRVYRFAPDLAVEILSEGNTPQEMDQKFDEYFEAGVRLVWYIDLRSRTAQIYTARQQMTTIDTSGHLDGGDVLPGFSLRLGELFERADRRRGPTN